ncbi:excinuclease ABC subunit UvrA [Candidatus Babeliales bacterium]|nr:excinuclease ABC subunit UvrA [Candidatus Babeliales bacterium]
MDKIIIKGARQHNLKNIDLEIPRNKLVVITGVSGSGKSTLAFDTLYAEGQRRYVESLSSYARQFLGVMDKPDVDSIEGLSPAISIEQKSISKNPRSTVGTITEIYDYLRLLYARIGKIHCPKCKSPVSPQTSDMITDSVMRLKGKEVQIFSPVVRKEKGTHKKLFEDLSKEGFSLVLIDGEEFFTDSAITLDKNKKHDVLVVLDQFKVEDRHHVSDSIQTALNLSKGYVIIKTLDDLQKKLYTSHSSCTNCDIFLEDFDPRHFSFNSPFGACQECSGLGVKYTFDEDLIIPDKGIAIGDGALKAFRLVDGYRVREIASIAKICEFSIFKPWKDLSKVNQKIILYGLDESDAQVYKLWKGNKAFEYLTDYEGVVPLLERLYEGTDSDFRRKDLERFMRSHKCAVCSGKRLNKEALAVFINGLNIIDVTELSIEKTLRFFKDIKLSNNDALIADLVLKEIISRLTFLESVGLNYLSLSRNMETISGGEAQRIRLATQIGSNLMGVMYILDEPSIGLHQRDNEKLISTLKRLRDLGNTVIVVEHDEDTVRAADYVVDIGPGAGVHGGAVVSSGTPEEVTKDPNSLTGKYLSRELKISGENKKREPKGFIEVKGARENNLKNIDVRFPTGVLTCVTGVSGSGKSTLVNGILAKALAQELFGSKEIPGKYDSIQHDIGNLIVIDQSPIGRTPRSNPVTYTKIFDYIRKLFAATKEARARGYKEGRFSFNVRGGRCENCQGDGTIKIEMNFLPDVYVKCDECDGKRYNQETLEILYKGKNIHQILSMNIEEALKFFDAVPLVKRKLQTLYDVGLSYIELGQSATTLSGGEAQRIKLSRELSKTSTKNTLYVLDEPTTGLHFDDVNKLLGVLSCLVSKGASCIVIEHNLDVIKNADYIIDLGLEGGDAGGTIVATGCPEELAKSEKSYTGKFLKKLTNFK